MADKLYQKGLSPIKLGITIALCLFSIASIFLSMAQGDEIFNIFYCLATIPFAAMPLLLSLMFKWRINTATP